MWYAIAIFVTLLGLARCYDWAKQYLSDRRHDAWLAKCHAWVEQVAAEAATDLHSDLHPRRSGLVHDDRSWLADDILTNLWRLYGEDRIVKHNRIVFGKKDRARFSGPIRARIQQILAELPNPLPTGDGPALPTVEWTVSEHWSLPGGIEEKVAVARVLQPADTGAVPIADDEWWAFKDGHLVRGGPGRGWRNVASAPDALHGDRGGFLAHDPARDAVVYWQCGWATRPSQTFTLALSGTDWQVQTHEYRTEDEYASVALLYDPVHGAPKRHGVTYTATRGSGQGGNTGVDGERPEQPDDWNEQPAGLFRLALSRQRWWLADPELGQTLVLDFENLLIARVAPSGWALVGRFGSAARGPDEYERFPDRRTLRYRWSAIRYDPRTQQLLCDGGDRTRGYRLDLKPVLARAVDVDKGPDERPGGD